MKKILLSFILVLCTFVMIGCNKKVTVKFISSLDETIISEEKVVIGETIIAPTPKVYVGYTFSGWDKELTSLKDDDTVYALYEKNVYTVIFKSSIDDLVIDTIEVEDGEPATAPEIKECATFITSCMGGYGCAREVIEEVLKAQGKWMQDEAFGW